LFQSTISATSAKTNTDDVNVGLSTEESQKSDKVEVLGTNSSSKLLEKPSISRSASCFSQAFFNWTVPIVQLAKEKRLTVDDFGGMREKD